MLASGACRVANCFIGVLLGLAGLLVTVMASLAQAPVAEAPTFQVGEEWRYTDGTVFRILAVEGDLVVTTSLRAEDARDCPDCRYYRDKNFTLVKVVDKNGKPVEDDAIGFKALDFPLQIGKEWALTQKFRSRPGSAYQSRPQEYNNTFKVEGYEEVQTKAGTFKAFKIAWTIKLPPYWSDQRTLWYSSDVKVVVKRQIGKPSVLRDRELESYTLK